MDSWTKAIELLSWEEENIFPEEREGRFIKAVVSLTVGNCQNLAMEICVRFSCFGTLRYWIVCCAGMTGFRVSRHESNQCVRDDGSCLQRTLLLP